MVRLIPEGTSRDKQHLTNDPFFSSLISSSSADRKKCFRFVGLLGIFMEVEILEVGDRREKSSFNTQAEIEIGATNIFISARFVITFR